MSGLKLRKGFGLGEEYNRGGRWSRRESDYESGLIEGQQARVEALPALLVSDDPMDRVRAAVYIDSLRVTVPAFVVVETPDSPSLYAWDREPTDEQRTRIIARRFVWSAHLDEQDAREWAAEFDREAEALRARHRWGEGSRRIFGVEFWDNAPIQQLRIRGADAESNIRRSGAFT